MQVPVLGHQFVELYLKQIFDRRTFLAEYFMGSGNTKLLLALQLIRLCLQQLIDSLLEDGFGFFDTQYLHLGHLAQAVHVLRSSHFHVVSSVR